MNTEAIVRGIRTVIEGLSMIESELSKSTPELKSNADQDVKVPTEISVTEKSEPIQSPLYTKEQLDSMKYAELKKLATSLNVSGKGTRDEITANILAVVSEDATADESEPVESETQVEETSAETSEEGEATEERDLDFYIGLAKEVAKEMSLDDIKNSLKEVGIAPPKKKSDVIEALGKAFYEGLIEIDEDEESDEEEAADDIDEGDSEEQSEVEDSDNEEAEFELSEDSYFEQYDPFGINDPDSLSPKRAKAIKKMMTSLVSDIENDEITEDDMVKFIEDFCTEDELDDLGDDYTSEDIIALFVEMKKRLIDDDGDSHEGADPYEIGEENYCCGHVLQYDETSNKFICENCGTEYEAE